MRSRVDDGGTDDGPGGGARIRERGLSAAARGREQVLRLDLIGTGVDLVCPDAPTARAARSRWGWCVRGHERGAGLRVTVPSGVLPAPEEWWLRFTHEATRVAMEGVPRDHLLLHAAGAAESDGGVLVLAAPSGTGKTTAVTSLCRAGREYVTDELVVIGPTGSVRPFPKPLSRVVGPGRKAETGPGGLGLVPVRGGSAASQLRVATLVLLDRRRGCTPTLTPLALDQAIAALVPQSALLTTRADPLVMLARLVADVGTWRLTYGEIEQALPLLEGLRDRPPTPPAQSWRAAHVAGGRGVVVESGGMATALVLDGEQLMSLTRLAPDDRTGGEGTIDRYAAPSPRRQDPPYGDSAGGPS